MTRPVKWRRILALLAAGETLDTIQAQRLGDSCLPSTIARIQQHGIRVDRRLIKRDGWCGCPAYVSQYWLTPAEVEKARALLKEETA